MRMSSVRIAVSALLAAGCASSGGGAGSRTAEAAPAEAASGGAPPGARWSARGNEPAWSLTVDSDRLELVTNLGGNTAQGPNPVREATPDGHRWTARTDEGEVRVDVTPRVCRDSMSGMSFPDTVTVTVGGRTLAGCGGAPAALLEGEWLVSDVGGAPVAPDARPTLTFLPEGRIAGFASCNRYTGSYSLTGEGLTFGGIASTRMACPPPLLEQELRYLELLRSVVRHELPEEGVLVLVGEGDARITARQNAL